MACWSRQRGIQEREEDMRSKDCVRHAATLLAAGVALLSASMGHRPRNSSRLSMLATVDESYSYFYGCL